MLGLKGLSVLFAFIFLIVSTIISVIYGVINWNKDGDLSDQELKQEEKWLKEESKIEEKV